MEKQNIAELVAKMPETDRDIQAKKQQEEQAKQAQEQPKEGEKKPAPKQIRLGEASKVTGPDPAAAFAIFEAILAGGKASLLELLALIRDPSDSDFQNYKAGYVLHGIAIYVGRKGQEANRHMFNETLATQLNSEKYSKAVRAFFIRELQVTGDRSVVPQIAAHLTDEELCETATQALLAIKDDVAEPLKKAFASAQGKDRVTLAQALGVLREPGLVSELKNALTDADPNVRITAAWALANIGTSEPSAALLKASDQAENWERMQTTKACLVLAEKLQARGNATAARAIYTHLREKRTDATEAYIRAVAERALNKIQ